jgi:predicted transcriptional regulator
MIDFACSQFELDEIIKCGFGLTKAEYKILVEMAKTDGEWRTAEEIAKKLKIDTSTAQRAVKKLHEKNIVERAQNNLSGGGYLFIYKIKNKAELRKTLIAIINSWTKRAETEINKW